MGAQGTAVLDFGAHPGKTHATVDVTGQTGIVAGSLIEAWIRPEASAEHSADEHMLEALSITARDIVAGTGFTIHGTKPHKSGEGKLTGRYNVGWVWN